MTDRIDELETCETCAMIAYYGERHAIENCYDADETRDAIAGLERLELPAGGASDVAPSGFSWMPCEICRVPLGGQRETVTFITYNALTPREIRERINK